MCARPKPPRTGPEPIVLAWSGGKDAALALHEIAAGGAHRVVALLTTVNERDRRVPMHGVRERLVQLQARALGLPLRTVYIPPEGSRDGYAERMRRVLDELRAAGVRAVAFGDLSLDQVRRRREEKLAQVGMSGIFPLWGRRGADVVSRFIDLGFRAVVTCVQTATLGGAFLGQDLDARFVADLEARVSGRAIDPAGEGGEYHTFVYDGPPFSSALRWTRGRSFARHEGYLNLDLIPTIP
jgi:uncharacterized protein (TIGR00290 family)